MSRLGVGLTRRLAILLMALGMACAKEPAEYECFFEDAQVDEPPPDWSDQYTVCMPRRLGGCPACDGDDCYDELRDANPDDANLADFDRAQVAVCGPEPIGDDDRCCYRVTFYDGE